MTSKSITMKGGDASGRGSVAGYKVNFPARMRRYSEGEINAVVDVMRNSEVQTQGAHMRQFEADFKAYVGANHAFAVDNATNALRLAAILCRVGPGDEVIIPAYTFCATAIPFGMTGATIVWADMDPKTWEISPEDIERKITPRTKAIVVVHLLGMPVDMAAVMAIAEKHGLRVVEDCAQAPGAAINGQKVGSFGDFGCFSFHGAKNITTLGEGGMLTVKHDADAALVPGVRHNGVRGFTGERERYWVPAMSNVDIDLDGVWPNNFCLGEAQSALGSELLKSLDQSNDILFGQATKLRALLADVPELTLVHIPEGYRHIFHQFVLHFDGSAFGKNRNDLLDFLTSEAGIRAIVQYHPLYRYPLFKSLGAGEHDCPRLEKWWDNSFSLPWWIGMPDETLEYLADSVKAGIAALKAA
ncbi:MAG TPA: DegT/DnrJ/EryC1/StrS family aminotransferase [Anaerolineales bacterium]|nr:DegT/DnrJ/EryC1/StrS family aminotransferase [Anaerolineales bacterium]